MRVTITSNAYNEHRYGLPWIAKVTKWAVGGKPELSFGTFLGTPGSSGECEIEAEPGDIIRWGQKDYRNPSKSESKYGVVSPTGEIRTITMVEARELFK